ncbi:MAG: tape measure protein [Clostridia bacterium]|nr:tape measure protein [Clostridia bacterium]
MPNGHDLFASARLDASGVSEGVKQAKTALTTFNRALIENKSEMKAVSTELKQLEKAQSELAQEMKKTNQPTEEQQAKMAQLSDRIGELRMQSARLKTEETDLKRKISGTTKELGQYYDKAKQASDATGTMSTKMQGLGAALKAVAMGYTGKKLYDALIGNNADMEQYLASFETALGSAEAAQQMVRNIASFSARTPLELPDVSEYTKLLMNYGYASDGVLDKLQQLGDLAEGNATKLGSVTKAYGQMYAKGKVTGEELLQMTEAGVPLLNALASTMNRTAGEVQDMVSKGQVGIAELDAAIASLTTGTGRFAGAMEKQSTTMNGMLSTLQDNLAQMGRDAGQQAFQQTKAALSDVLALLEKAQKDGTVTAIAETAGKAIKNIIEVITGLIKAGYDCKDLLAALLVVVAAYNVAVAATPALLAAQKVETIAVSLATGELTLKQAALNTVMNANPYALVIAALTGLCAGMVTLKAHINEANDAYTQSVKATEKATQQSEAHARMIRNTYNEYEALRTKLSKTEQDKDNLRKAAKLLQAVLGEGVEVIDAQTGAYNDLSGSIEKAIERAEAQAKLNRIAEEYEEAVNNISTAQEKLNKLKEKQENDWTTQTFGKMGQGIDIRSWLKGDGMTMASQIDILQSKVDGYNAVIEYHNQILRESIGDSEQAASQLDEQSERVGKMTAAAGELADALASVESATKLYESVTEEVKETQTLSLSTMQKIVDKYPEMEDVIYRYIGGLIKEQDVLNAMAGCYKADYNNYYSLIRAKLANDTTFYNNVIAANTGIVNKYKEQYSIDLANYASYTAAKAAIDEQYYKAVSTAPDLGPAALTDIRSGNTLSSVRQSAAKARLKAQGELSALFHSAFTGAGANFQTLVKQSVANAKGQTSQSGGSGSSAAKQELSAYEIANEAYKKLVNERIELVEAERDAKKEALDEAIAAIDAEIEARKRLTEDKSIEKEIQAIEAQLTYAKMDDFSRMELERELQKLREEQAETQWQRDMADQKAALQAGYDTASEELQAMVEELRRRLDYAGTLFDRLDGGAQTAAGIVNNNSTTANVQIVNQALSAGQIAREIIRQLMDGVI